MFHCSNPLLERSHAIQDNLPAGSSSVVPASCCFYRHLSRFSATFVCVSDQVLHAEILITDPELTFFKEVIGLRDEDIQHTFENGFKFFNDTYGLDFSLSTPNGVHGTSLRKQG